MKGAHRICSGLMAVVAASALLAARVFAQPASPPATAPVVSPEQFIQNDIEHQRQVLNDPNPSLDLRDPREQAAERLLEYNRPTADQILLDALQGNSAVEARLAVARAIAASRRSPDPAFLQPLGSLLTSETPAAAEAIARYASGPSAGDALGMLISFEHDNASIPSKQQARLTVIGAMGAFSARASADYLIQVVTGGTGDGEPLRNAAADALISITGLTANGRDAAKWNAWWQTASQISEDQWAATAPLVQRGAMANRKADELGGRVDKLLSDVYQATTVDAKREAELLEWMRDAQPAFRLAAVRIAYSESQSGRTYPESIGKQLRAMIGDSSPEVRRSVIITLRDNNEADSIDAILAQLSIERDTEVKLAIASALSTFRKLAGVDPLLKLLNDPSLRVEEAASVALAKLQPVISKDPAVLERVETQIRDKLQAVDPQNAPLRAALIGAAAALGDRQLYRQYSEALNRGDPRNTEPVRIAAAKGLGNMTDPADRDSAVTQLIEALDRDTRDVRLAAVQSIEKVGTFDRVNQVLLQRMSDRVESDRDVRSAAWEALQSLAKSPSVSSDTALRLADNPTIQEDPDKRLIIQQKVAVPKLLAEANNRPEREETLANTRQNIGDGLWGQSKWGDALPFYHAALDYWRGKGKDAPLSTVRFLTERVEGCYLRSGNYSDAVKFAGEAVKADAQTEGIMGRAIINRIEDLNGENKPDEAKKLANEALTKMQPPFNPDIQADITDKRDHPNGV